MADETGSESEAGKGAVERILQMVSDGRLTAEQASALLRALPRQGDGASEPASAPASGPEGDGRGRFFEGRGGAGRGPRGEGLGFDLTQLGRIGRQVARRVERELDGLERSARRGWFDDDGEESGRPAELLWSGAAPEDGRLVLDVAVDNASVRVLADPEATEIRVLYQDGGGRSIGADALSPRVHMDGGRLVVRQRQRGVMIRFSLASERLTVRLPATVVAVDGEVHSRNGSVRVEDVALGRAEVRTDNGAARVRARRAESLEVHSTNGRVEVAVESAQRLRASSSNGKVEIEGAIVHLDADAGNGKVVARALAPAEDAAWRLSAGNGRVEVYLPPAPVGLKAQVRSAVGRVDTDLPAAEVRWLGRGSVGAEAEISRAAGAGAATITLEARATNGSIALREGAAGESGGAPAL